MKKTARATSPIFFILTAAVVGIFVFNSASAQTSSFFLNPSAETINAAGDKPQSWQPDIWGTTRAILSFPSLGAQDGSRYLQTQITKKGNGDAKWYPSHVQVTPGQAYTFSDWYESDISSGVDVEYLLSNGSYQYTHLADLAPSSAWKKYQATFTAPPQAKSLTILHYIDSVGTLNTDNYSLVASSTISPAPVPLLEIRMVTDPPTQTAVPGAERAKLGSIILDATQSKEDVKLSTLSLSAAGIVQNLSSCQIFNGTPYPGANSINSVSTSTANVFIFPNPIFINKGTALTLDIKCSIAGGAALGNTYRFGVSNLYLYSAAGTPSGTAFTPSVTTGFGTIMTVASGSFSVAVDATSSPAYQIVAGNSTGVTIGKLKLRASNEPIILTKLGFKIVSGSSHDIVQLYIYDGSTQVGHAVFTGTNITATSTLPVQVTLQSNIDKILTIKADIQTVNASSQIEGDMLVINPLNAEAVGQDSGNTLKVSASGNTSGVRIVKSYPSIFPVSNAAAGISGTNVTLKRFTITSNAAGPVGLGKVIFSLATSSAKVSEIKFYAYTDAGYSQGVASQGSGTGLVGTACSSGCSSNAPTLSFIATNPLEVSGTIYLALIGNVTQDILGGSGTVHATLLGDAAFEGMKQESAVNGNFVWTPNATTTSAFISNDWTNGFGVAGLPVAGI